MHGIFPTMLQTLQTHTSETVVADLFKIGALKNFTGNQSLFNKVTDMKREPATLLK